MSLIDERMPTYGMRQTHRAAVAADPRRTWRTVRDFDLYDLDFVRALFELRALPERMRLGASARATASRRTSRIDDITDGTGFVVLGEAPGTEIVVGAVGTFWKPDIEFAHVTPETFAGFDAAGYAKVAWCIDVRPREGGGSWLSIDLRVTATDAESWAKFQRYWRVIGRFSHLIRTRFMHKFRGELGRPADDEAMALAGDELLPSARVQRTHAITIEAPPRAVFPWLLQMGGSRAGWYSYDFLDHGGVPSERTVHPEWQSLAIGDVIAALPGASGGFAVLQLEPGRALVLGDPALLPPHTAHEGPPWSSTWAFVLEPIGDTATRLRVRVRASFDPSVAMSVVSPAVLAVHEAMERKQLHGLRERAETTFGAAARASLG